MRKPGLHFLRALLRRTIAHPRSALAIVALVTLTAAPGMWRLRLRTDGHALLSENAPEVIYDKSVREQFGIEDNIVVVVSSHDPDGIFNRATLELTRDLTAEFQRLPGINPSNVISLATEPGFRFAPQAGGNLGLIRPALTNQNGLAQLHEDLKGIKIYTGTLVSMDGKCAAILIGVPSKADRDRLYRSILEIIARHRGAADEIAVTGAPVAESLLGIQILEDLGAPRAWLGPGVQNLAREGMGDWRQFPLRAARRVGLVPMAALVMMLTLLACFRNLVAALLPLPGVAAALMFVFGWMGWTGTPIYLPMAVMPVLLTVLSVTNDIYLFNRYFGLIRARPGAGREKLLCETFDSLVWPVACTALVAAVGFFSFCSSPLAPVRAFGVFTALGALFGLFFSLTAVPALLALIPPGWLLTRQGASETARVSWLAAQFKQLGELAGRQWWWVAGGAVAVTLVAALGARCLVVQDSWAGGFDPDSAFRRTTQMVNEKFFGMHLLFVSFDATQTLTGNATPASLEPGAIFLPSAALDDLVLIRESVMTLSLSDVASNAASRAIWQQQIAGAARIDDHRIVARFGGVDAPAGFWESFSRTGQARYEIPVHSHMRPEVIQDIGALEAFIRERSGYAVGGTLGPWDYLTTTRFMTRPTDPAARQLENKSTENRLLWTYYGLALGPQRLRQLVDTNYSRSLTTVFLKDANFVDTARLMSEVRDYELKNLAPKGIKLGFAGDVAVSQSLIQGIVSTQLRSLAWSLAGIFAVTALMGGSVRWGLYCLLPSAWAVLIKFAVMGWLGIPLGVATSMFAAMTLGLGVSCAIHLLEGFEQARAAGAPPTEALNRVLALTGPPALINTLAISLGFGTLIVSHVPANARLGLLLALGLASCFVASLLILPVLLRWGLPMNLAAARQR